MSETPFVTTTAGQSFTDRESEALAALVYRRFGYDREAAAAAWRRLLGNSCPDEDFVRMAQLGAEAHRLATSGSK